MLIIVLLFTEIKKTIFRFRTIAVVFAAIAWAFAWSHSLRAAPLPAFAGANGPRLSTAGYYTIAWKDQAGTSKHTLYELAEFSAVDSSDFRMVYRGKDRATTLSGRPNGVYYYRIRRQGGEFSPAVVTVRVRHHSLEQAFAFLAAGGIVFLCTLILIVTGSVRNADPEQAADP